VLPVMGATVCDACDGWSKTNGRALMAHV
jgi:hypothetical protein